MRVDVTYVCGCGCGCDPLLWMLPMCADVTNVCECDPLLWMLPMVVDVTHGCGCDPWLWVWSMRVDVTHDHLVKFCRYDTNLAHKDTFVINSIQCSKPIKQS